MLENEYTFLVKKLPDDLSKCPKKEIKQGYFSDMPSPLRVRQSDDKYTLTKKVPLVEGDHSRYNETEIPIKKEEFDRLWPVTKKSLTKIRYYYPLENNLKAEIDVYHGKLEGYMNVEVEFPSEEVRSTFKIPDWFGADITQADWSANSILCDMTYDEIKKIIK
jgi:CYTH domain-containing protein